MAISRKLIWFALFLNAGCSTMVMTPYGPKGKDGGGYVDRKLEREAYVVSFSANADTPVHHVENYVLFRSGELCKADGFQYWEVASFRNDSQVDMEHVVRYQPPFSPGYYYNIPSYALHPNPMRENSSISDAPRIYPNLTVVTLCYAQPDRLSLGVPVVERTPEEVQKLGVIDGMGAVQVAEVSAEMKSPLDSADIILRVNGRRVVSRLFLFKLLKEIDASITKVAVEFLRGGKSLTAQVTLEKLKVTFGPSNFQELSVAVRKREPDPTPESSSKK
jgi:hypothetical protein